MGIETEIGKLDISSIFAAVTASDSTVLSGVRSLYIGGAGDVVATPVSGPDVTFTAVPAGTILPIGPIKVKATGTTATGIVALS